MEASKLVNRLHKMSARKPAARRVQLEDEDDDVAQMDARDSILRQLAASSDRLTDIRSSIDDIRMNVRDAFRSGASSRPNIPSRPYQRPFGFKLDNGSIARC